MVNQALDEIERAIEIEDPAALITLGGALERLRLLVQRRLLAPRVETPPPAAGPERAVGIEEGARLLGMSKDYLYRHWAKLGGYRDDDRRVKFPLSEIQRHIRSGRPRA